MRPVQVLALTVVALTAPGLTVAALTASVSNIPDLTDVESFEIMEVKRSASLM